ncbi:MAG: peptidoglycan-binding domain-containing protein [bacterium]
MQKKFFAVATFALAFAVAFSASAYDLGSTTLKRGSTGAAVVELQKALNEKNGAGLATDGSFGRGTESAVKAFQASKNLGADGKAGALTKAALNASTSTTTTTTSTAGLCPNGMTLASNCTMSPSTSWGSSSSAEGYLADIASDSSNLVSTVYESEQDKVVNGFRATARLADQKIEKVTVTLLQTNGSASVNLAKYASSVSLWNGSTKLATMSVANADRSTSTDLYTFNFTGLSSIIAKDTAGRFYVSINANGALDSVDATNATWVGKITEVRATSPNGVYVTTNGSPFPLSKTFGFGKFSANGVKAEVALASSNPTSQTVTVSETSNTNDKTLLKFKITAKNTSLTLRKVGIKITSSGADLEDIINTVKLYRDATQLDNKSGDVVAASAMGTYVFDNLSGTSIASGSSAEFSVSVDLKKQVGNYTSGVALTAEFTDLTSTNFSVQDANGDQLQAGSTYRSGSAVGSAMTLRTKGVSATAGSATAPVSSIGNSSTQQVTFSFPLNLIGSGVDYYVPKAAQLVTTGASMPGSATASKGIYFAIQNLTSNAFLSSAAANVDSSATVYGTNPEQLLASNTGTNATLKVTINGNGTAAYYKLYVLGFAGAESLNGTLSTYAVDNASAFTVTSNGAVQ